MSIQFTKLTNLSKILLMASIATLFAFPANAEMKSLHEEFEDTYFSKGKDTFIQSNIFSQIDTILGFTGFPDQHIVIDGKKIDTLYQEGMKQQSSMGERMVTRDLANPYNSSIRENPSYSAIK